MRLGIAFAWGLVIGNVASIIEQVGYVGLALTYLTLAIASVLAYTHKDTEDNEEI